MGLPLLSPLVPVPQMPLQVWVDLLPQTFGPGWHVPVPASQLQSASHVPHEPPHPSPPQLRPAQFALHGQ